MPPFKPSSTVSLTYDWIKRYPLVFGVTSAVAVLPLATVAAYWTWESIRDWRLKPRFDSSGLTRPLSRLEMYYSTRNLAKLKPNFYIAAQLTGSVWTKEQTLKFAKLAMIRHAPSLFTLIDDDSPDVVPTWKRLWHPSYAEDQQGIIDIRFEDRETTTESDETWSKVGERLETEGFQFATDTPRDPRLSLFRIGIVSHASCEHWEMVLMPHHAVMDVYGAVEFLKVMFSAAASERERPGSTPDIDLSLINIQGAAKVSNQLPIPWPKSTEDLWNTSLGFKNWTKALLPFYFPLITKIIPWYYQSPEPKAWLGPVDRGTPLEPTGITFNSKVPAAVLDPLYVQAKNHGTTINSALWAAILYAAHVVHRHLKSASQEEQSGVIDPPTTPHDEFSDSPSNYHIKPTGRITVSTQNPVNFRSRAKTDQSDNWSCIVAATNSEWSIDLDDEFWAKCRTVQDSVAEKSKTAVKNYGVIPHIPRPSVPWLVARSMGGHNRVDITIGLSNGGRLDIKKSIEGSDKKLRMRDMWFARHGATDGHLLAITVLTPGEGGDLNVSITGAEELTPLPTMKLFQRAFANVLEYASRQSGPFTYSQYEFERPELHPDEL